jgi:hypothetical protein
MKSIIIKLCMASLFIGLFISCSKDEPVTEISNGDKIAQNLKSAIGTQNLTAFVYEYKWDDLQKSNEWILFSNNSSTFEIEGSFIYITDSRYYFNLNNLQKFQINGGILNLYFSVDE